MVFGKNNDKILKGINKGMMTGMILIDLQKTFDIVNLDVLLEQLYATGFSKHTANWFQIIFLNLHSYPAVHRECLFWGQSLFIAKYANAMSQVAKCDLFLNANDSCPVFQHKNIKKIENEDL